MLQVNVNISRDDYDVEIEDAGNTLLVEIVC